MPDTIQNAALVDLIPDKDYMNVFLGGILAYLPDGGSYPADLVQIPLTKVSLSIEIDKGESMGPNATSTYLEPVRRWIKSIKRSLKCESTELKNAGVLAILNAGYVHADYIKVVAKDPADAADTASILIGEFAGQISLDGSIEGTQGELSVAPLAIDIEGASPVAANSGMS